MTSLLIHGLFSSVFNFQDFPNLNGVLSPQVFFHSESAYGKALSPCIHEDIFSFAITLK